MAGYVIANVDVKDATLFAQYRKQVPDTLARYGGKYLVRGGAHRAVEGRWAPARLVVLEFPSIEQARQWYESEEYREPKALRMKCALSDVVIVEGA